jgi:predicted nucleic acid-binding protein
MLILVDTPIWSLALRRSSADLNPREQCLTAALRELIRDGRAQLVGPVRQELLAGLRREAAFRKLRDQLRSFDEPPLDVDDYEEAARIHDQCPSHGDRFSSLRRCLSSRLADLYHRPRLRPLRDPTPPESSPYHFIVESRKPRTENCPQSCFAIAQYKSIASTSCRFSMNSPSVCAT